MPDVNQNQTLNQNAQPPNQTSDNQAKTYVDDYQPPENLDSTSTTISASSRSSDSGSLEPEISPADAEAALNQVLRQLDNDPVANQGQDQKTQSQDSGPKTPPTDGQLQDQGSREEASASQPDSMVAQPQSSTDATSDASVMKTISAGTSQGRPPVVDDEIAKAKQTLEQILAEIEAKKIKSANLKTQNSEPKGQNLKDKPQSQVSSASMVSATPDQPSVKTETKSGHQPTDQLPTDTAANRSMKLKPSVSAEEAKKAREELMEILDKLALGKAKNTRSKADDLIAETTQGQGVTSDQSLSTQSPRAAVTSQSAVETKMTPAKSQPMNHDLSASTSMIGSSQSSTTATEKPASQLLDFNSEDDLPVKVDNNQTQNSKLKGQSLQPQTQTNSTQVAPPAATQPPTNSSTSKPQSAPEAGPSEKLEDQNIFFMLGVADAKEAEKERFLDELQQVVWEDFLDSDVKLLLTEDEYRKLEELLKQQQNKDFANQAEIVAYLEKLIPDLEEIMVEKAVELKADMFKERLADLRSQYRDDQAKLAQIDQAEQLIQQNRWYSAAQLLNQL